VATPGRITPLPCRAAGRWDAVGWWSHALYLGLKPGGAGHDSEFFSRVHLETQLGMFAPRLRVMQALGGRAAGTRWLGAEDSAWRYARSLGPWINVLERSSWSHDSPPAIWCWKRSQTIAPMPRGRPLWRSDSGASHWVLRVSDRAGLDPARRKRVGVSEHAGFLSFMHEIIKSYPRPGRHRRQGIRNSSKPGGSPCQGAPS